MEQGAPRILVVDDENAICQVIQDYLSLRKFEVATAGNYDEATSLLGTERFDVLLSDIRMPGKSGTDLLRFTRRHYPNTATILFTGYADIGIAVTSMQEGAYDFILKPIHLEQVHMSIHNALEKRALKEEVRRYQRGLEDLVEKRTKELREALRLVEAANLDTVTRLSRAAEMRDDETGNHVLRIRSYSAALARELGMAGDEVGKLYVASSMHDVGKIGIPDHILLKPGRLDAEELAIMKNHAVIGARILADADSPMLQVAQVVARSHHEKWDGSGYPDGLTGEAIPLPGRIVALADVWDALTTRRCYKSAFSLDSSRDIILKSSGSHFDPDVVAAFRRVEDEFHSIFTQFHDDGSTISSAGAES
ncbi:MAG TPA: response regulator [Fibrobacteria bacterium]|nr:response regulator [Fibrobacteria bacterium]HOX52017.1 response regulator [Fibrobacteria bacterium]